MKPARLYLLASRDRSIAAGGGCNSGYRGWQRGIRPRPESRALSMHWNGLLLTVYFIVSVRIVEVAESSPSS